MGKLTREAIIQLQITHIKEAKVKVSEFILFIVCVAQMAQLSKSINVASKQQILNNVKIFNYIKFSKRNFWQISSNSNKTLVKPSLKLNNHNNSRKT